MAKSKPKEHKLLLTLPESLEQELQKEADKQYRPLTNYIRWILVHRHKNKPE